VPDVFLAAIFELRLNRECDPISSHLRCVFLGQARANILPQVETGYYAGGVSSATSGTAAGVFIGTIRGRVGP
jgi:hypothetical protein